MLFLSLPCTLLFKLVYCNMKLMFGKNRTLLHASFAWLYLHLEDLHRLSLEHMYLINFMLLELG